MADLGMFADCVSRATPVEKIADLRAQLFTDVTAWERLFALASELRMMPILIIRLRERALIPPNIADFDPGQLSPAAILSAQWYHHEASRKRQEITIDEVVSIINRMGIEPLLLKGARTLWCGTDPWRSMRDLDILVPALCAHDVHQALIAAGFKSQETSISGQSHLAPLFRPDLPGWLEIHHSASGHYAEPFLSTEEIVKRSLQHEKAGRHARVMMVADHIWHGLIHHHFGHRSFRTGSIDIKGLFEFAEGIAARSQTEFEVVSRLAHRNAAGLAAFELWIAAAVDLFGVRLPTGAALALDTKASWERMKRRIRHDRPAPWYLGYFETIKLAIASDRIRRVVPGRARGSFVTEWQAIERLLPRWRLD